MCSIIDKLNQKAGGELFFKQYEKNVPSIYSYEYDKVPKKRVEIVRDKDTNFCILDNASDLKQFVSGELSSEPTNAMLAMLVKGYMAAYASASITFNTLLNEYDIVNGKKCLRNHSERVELLLILQSCYKTLASMSVMYQSRIYWLNAIGGKLLSISHGIYDEGFVDILVYPPKIHSNGLGSYSTLGLWVLILTGYIDIVKKAK